MFCPRVGENLKLTKNKTGLDGAGMCVRKQPVRKNSVNFTHGGTECCARESSS